MGSSQLSPHVTNIENFLTSVCAASTVTKVVDQTHVKCVNMDDRMVQPHVMIGDNTFPKLVNDTTGEYIIQSIKTLIMEKESADGDPKDLSFMDELISLNTTLCTFGTINETWTELNNGTITRLSPTNTTLNNTSLTMFPTNSSNPTLTRALTIGVGLRKLPEILIIQDQQYLPLYSTYRDKSVGPALQQILTYAREASFVLLLPSWADPILNTDDLKKGLSGYATRSALQTGMDEAYHQMETHLQKWIDNQTYPIPVIGANDTPSQPKPTLATIPLGPVFNDIIDKPTWSNYTYDIYHVTRNNSKSNSNGTSTQYLIMTPTLNITGTTNITGVDLLYRPNGLLTLVGEYVISLLLFSTMYNRSVVGSIIPVYNVSYDVDEMGGPPVANVQLSIPYITNETATHIQQLVDKHVMASNFTLASYTWLPTEPPPTPTPTPTPSSSSSSSSSDSSSSSSSNSTSPPSSPSPTSFPSSSTGVGSPSPSSSDVGFKWTWSLVIAGIIVASAALYCCYRKKQTRAKAGYGFMQFDTEKGYEVELVDQ